MSAGYIQLAAIGQQDAYLTGSPQITYFSGVYRRHTPFVLESYDIPFLSQKVNYGQTNICRIPGKGDLIKGLTLKLNLPALTNPGADWNWPTFPDAVTNDPHIRVNAPATGGSNTTLTATLSVTTYSTNNIPVWFTLTFGPYVEYNSAINKFVFSNCASIEVENSSSPLASGVFFGLDPRAYSNINPVSGNLIYTVNSTSNLQANSISNSFANFVSTISRSADFTLEQSGWVRSQGTLPAESKTGYFTYLNQPLNVFGQQFLNLVGTSINGPYWTITDASIKYLPTTGGRLRFAATGLYALRAGFELGSGSVATLSYGSSTTEAIDGGGPINPDFEYTYTYRVSPDPSVPAIIPINVKNTSNTYYFYMGSTGTQLQANSYISINPVDEIYKIGTTITMDANPCRIQLYGNVSGTSNTTVTLSPNSIIQFQSTGEYLISGYLSVGSGYVSNISLWQGSTMEYVYDMSLQGRDPTFAFTIPLVVSNVSNTYTMNLATTTMTSISPISYFIVTRIGVYTGDTPNSVILPDNGLILRPSSTTLTRPFNFVSNFTSYGSSNLISYTAAGLKFSNTGTYMIGGTVCTADVLRSVSVGSITYNVSLGISPPYNFNIPLIVKNTNLTYPVSVTVNGSTAAPNIFSNTFISVHPVTAPPQGGTTASLSPYYDSVGTWAIKSAELKIGGQSIQTLTGEYIELWNDLYVSYENQPGLQILTGKNDNNTTINPPGRTYYINLPFYFYGHPALYLPIVALSRQDVEVHVTLRDFTELTAVTVNNPTLDATIIVDYVYLSNPEIKWFQNSRLDYIITQCQYQSIDLLPNFTTAVFNLNFKNPVREIFLVVQPTNQLTYDYSNNAVLSFGLSFNGQDLFTTDTTDTLYSGSIEPFNHYPNFPQRKFYMYAFTGRPSSPKPYGQINFSRIKQVLLTLNCGGQAYLPAKQLRVLAVNYNILQIADGLGGLRFNT